MICIPSSITEVEKRAVRDSAVEIQGDHAEKLIEHLTRQGHRVRRVGG
jgi:translation initiation factor 1 (eIF-1/SUI1)